jgi:hypothetical protein
MLSCVLMARAGAVGEASSRSATFGRNMTLGAADRGPLCVHDLVLIDRLRAGFAAGLVATFATNPADVVRTHMQLWPQECSTLRGTVSHVIEVRAISRVKLCLLNVPVQSGRWKSMFRGILPRQLRKSLMTALNWALFEDLTRER